MSFLFNTSDGGGGGGGDPATVVTDGFEDYNLGETAPGPWTQLGGSSEISNTQAYNSTQSFNIVGPNNTRYVTTTFTASQYSGTFGFKYWEPQSNGRLALEFRTSNDEQLLLVGSDNPTPTIEGASKTTFAGPSPDYETWREFEVVFNWSTEEADITFTDLGGSTGSSSATVALKATTAVDIAEIALVFPQNDSVWGGDPDSNWYADDVVIVE